MFDLSMFSPGTHAEHRHTSGTPGTPAKNAGVPLKPAGVPSKISNLHAVEHLEHVEHLKNSNTVNETAFLHSEEWQEAFEERAAIMEHLGGLPRGKAEQEARVICLEEFRNRRRKH